MPEIRVAPSALDLKSPARVHARGVSDRPHPDLSSRAAWALEHIGHCPTCGAWEMATDHELRRRAEPGWSPPTWCAHVRPDRIPA